MPRREDWRHTGPYVEPRLFVFVCVCVCFCDSRLWVTATSAPAAASDGTVTVLDAEVSKLVAHTGEVFACQWNPKFPNILATGASDAMAVLWTVPSGRSGPGAGKKMTETRKSLAHGTPAQSSHDVTTLEWSPDGTLLSTGSYDGTARLWTQAGVAAGTLQGHQGPIFSLRWTTDAKYILSGGVDKTARIWEVKTGREVKRFNVHSAPTLDVAWKDNTSFATCSSDKTGKDAAPSFVRAHSFVCVC